MFLVFIIFLVLGVTRLGSKLVELIPRSMKGGIIIGAGIAALMGEIEAGGRLAETPISLIVGGLVCLYLMFSVSFKGFVFREARRYRRPSIFIVLAILFSNIHSWTSLWW